MSGIRRSLAPLLRSRPRFGLAAILAALALFSVGAWFYSPASPSPLPPRRSVERAVILQGFGEGVPSLGHLYAAMSSSQIDRLYATLDDAVPLDVHPVDLELVLSVRIYANGESRHLQMFAGRRGGIAVETYDDDSGEFEVFWSPLDADSFQILRETLIESKATRRATADR